MPKIDIKLAAKIAEQCEKEGMLPSDAFRKLDNKIIRINKDVQLEFSVSMTKRERDIFEIQKIANNYLLETDPEKSNEPRMSHKQLLLAVASRRVELHVNYPHLFKKMVRAAYQSYYDLIMPEKHAAHTLCAKTVMPFLIPWLQNQGMELTGTAH